MGDHHSVLRKQPATSGITSQIPIEALIAACSDGDIATVEGYVRAGGNVNVQDKLGSTPLLAAIGRNQTDIVKVLLENGAGNKRPQEEDRVRAPHSEFLVQTNNNYASYSRALEHGNHYTSRAEESSSHGEDMIMFKEECLGQGAFGSVYKGTLNGKPCAIKLLYALANEIRTGLPTTRNVPDKAKRRFEMECERLEKFDHPNIVKHLATKRHPQTDHLLLALELMDCNLRDFFSIPKDPLLRLPPRKNLPLQTQIKLCRDIASALAYIHSQGIVHRDIFSDNILLNYRKQEIPVAKVCDFGMAKIISSMDKSMYVMRHRHKGYLPPEALRPQGTETESFAYEPTFDIFSFGVIMIQIARQLPVINSEEEQTHELSQLESDNPLKHIITSCLKKNKECRPTAEELKKELY